MTTNEQKWYANLRLSILDSLIFLSAAEKAEAKSLNSSDASFKT